MQDVTRLIMMPPRPGTCPVCAVAHREDMPHNPNSMYYKMRFYQQNGRMPTWKDAMAHCPEDIQRVWTAELEALGEKVSEDNEGGA